MKKKIITGIFTLVLAVCLTIPSSAADCPENAPPGAGLAGIDIVSLFSCENEDGNNNALQSWLLNCITNMYGKDCDTKPGYGTEDDCNTEDDCDTENTDEPEDNGRPQKPGLPERPSRPDEDDEDDGGEPEENDEQDDSFSAYAREVLELVNVQRQANGLSKLTLNSDLCYVAQVKAQDMKDNNYFDHTSPTYGTPFQMMQTFGISYRTAGENIAMGYSSPSAVVNGWMNSEGHRANILNSSFTQMGIGYVSSGNYWCQMFIG